MSRKNLPTVLPISGSEQQRSSDSRSDSAQAVWLRLSAFLKLRSPNTESTYNGILKEWCEFLGVAIGTNEGAKKICAATDLHAAAFRVWLEKRPGERPRAQRKQSAKLDLQVERMKRKKKEGLEYTLSNATIAKKFAALRRMYRMLISVGAGVTQNPFDSDRVPAPAKDSGRKRPTEMLDFTKVKEVIAEADSSTPKGLRDKAVLCALFGAGLRRSEVLGLRVGDVRRTPAGTVFLYLRSTKAKRDAQQALPRWAAEVLESLVKQRVQEGAEGGDYLFISYTGQAGKFPTSNPISASGIYLLFKKYCMLAGAGAHVSPHSARATAITRLLAEGIPHREVQEFSRHSSIQMVELYDKRRLSVDQNPGKELKYD